MTPALRRTLAGSALVGGAVAASAAALRSPVFGAAPEGARLARMERSPQWRDGAFHNPEGARVGASPGAIWEWLTKGAADRRPSGEVPVVERRRTSFVAPQDLRLTWFGHSSVLIEVEGARFLTDPVWSPTASPGAAFGVRRFFEPPLPLDQLPELDAVLLTHDHYDHLDWHTIRQLAPLVPRWVAPLGVGAHLERWGVPAGRIVELDWWEETTVAGLRVVSTPARHFSGRGLGDRNRTLWTGWAVVGEDRRVYVTGDGGYQAAFAEVGRRLGPFDVTLAEIGAYNARWADIHMGPEQAVRAVQDARGGVLFPVHWGTFDLALHSWTEPVERVLVAAEAAGVPVVAPRPGESVYPFDPPPVDRWWPDLAWQTAADAPIVSSGMGG